RTIRDPSGHRSPALLGILGPRLQNRPRDHPLSGHPPPPARARRSEPGPAGSIGSGRESAQRARFHVLQEETEKPRSDNLRSSALALRIIVRAFRLTALVISPGSSDPSAPVAALHYTESGRETESSRPR